MFSRNDNGLSSRLTALLAAGAIASAFTLSSASAAHADDLERTSDDVVAAIEGQPWPQYTNGDDNVDIQAAQMLLAYHGFDSGEFSPAFGDELEEQVLAFQSVPANDLVETGELDEETWLLLRERTFGEFGPGSSGIVVEMIQVLLNAKFDSGLDVDGLYGEATEAAVEEAQDFFGIGVDGIFGPLTFRAVVHLQPDDGANGDDEEAADTGAPAEGQDDLRLY